MAQLALVTQLRKKSTFENNIAHGLSKFIRSMISEDGSFISKMNVRTGDASSFVSLYYPGETALSLLKYAMEYKDELYLQTALNILQYLSSIRKDLLAVPPDHWALLCTAEVFLLSSTGQIHVEDAKLGNFYFHAVQIVDKILGDAKLANDPSGALTENSQTCSSATRLEGLRAIYPLLEKYEYHHKDKVEDYIERGINYLLGSQIESGPLEGGMPWVSPHHSTYSSNPAAAEIRIDRVQHSIGAVFGNLNSVTK